MMNGFCVVYMYSVCVCMCVWCIVSVHLMVRTACILHTVWINNVHVTLFSHLPRYMYMYMYAILEWLAIIMSQHKKFTLVVLTELYSRLNFTLVRAVARALLARCAPSLGLQYIV
ncbi:hypothetical protein EMCRGX_G006878 [Ephydatia muelleri]